MDVVFILLIFFAVSSTVMIHQKGLKLDLPAAKSVTKHSEGVEVRIDRNKRIYVQGSRVSEDAVRTHIERYMQKDSKTKVVLHADRLTPYSQVIRILDEIRLGGCFDIILETKRSPQSS